MFQCLCSVLCVCVAAAAVDVGGHLGGGGRGTTSISPWDAGDVKLGLGCW